MSSSYYTERINAAIKFIDEHLSEEIKVEDVARATHFSTFHFQRIYRALRNESPYDTILRLRLEKAARELRYQGFKSIKNIASNCGFLSAENFSRQFKSRFGFTPTAFKKNKHLEKNSRIYQESSNQDNYHCIQEGDYPYEVIVEELPDVVVAMRRAVFGADGSELIEGYHDLINWADQNKVQYGGPMVRFGMSIDDPRITPAGMYRYDFAISNPLQLEVSGTIESSIIPGGKYVTIHVEGILSDVARAWNQLYQKWLPESDFIPRDYPSVEEFIQGPEEIGWERFNIKCRIPIQQIKR